jgi:PEP-CTERM motif
MVQRPWPSMATWAAVVLATAGPIPVASAATFTDSLLAAIGSNVGTALFTTPDAPGLQMTVSETTTTTMTGSSLFDYEGLWLGSDGTGGRYTFSFNQPVYQISFSFIALTNLGAGLTETLNSFVASAAVTSSFTSPDLSATWSGTALTPQEEDSRGVLTFNVVTAALNSIRFDHLQPAQLQGLVLERVDVQLSPVPEPGSLWVFALGLGAVLVRWRLVNGAGTTGSTGVEP